MISIGVVARQTGLNISTLRKWESRYGFPQPQRHNSGQRLYREEDVDTLHSIQRRIAAGERVGKVIADLHTGPQPNQSFAGACASAPVLSPAVARALVAIQAADLPAITAQLGAARKGVSLLRYVEDFAAPLTFAVGEAWSAGTLPVHAEHLFSALLETRLIAETTSFNLPLPPKLLLVTPAGEKHTLGLAMTHAVLAEAGVSCLRLFSDLPVAEIVASCRAHRIAAVGISASIHYSPRLLRAQIDGLRAQLPGNVELWLGGGGIRRVSALPANTKTFRSLNTVIECARALPNLQAVADPVL